MASGLGLDLGASAIKAVRVRRRGSTWQVLRAARIDDPAPPPPPVKPGRSAPSPPREVPQGLRAGLRRSGISGSGVAGLTGRDVMVKYVSTPPVPPWKLQMMMDLEIKGTSGAEVCGDHAALKIPGDLTREMVSLVAVGRSEYVKHQIGLASEAGVRAEWCCPNAVGLFNVFLASAQYRGGETTAVLDIGRDNIDLVLQRDGVLYFARGAAGGGRRFTDAIDNLLEVGYEKAESYKCRRSAIVTDGSGSDSETRISGALCEVADSVASSLRSATVFCRAQAKLSRLEVERIVLSGGGSRLAGLPAYLAKKTGLPVDTLDPASRMDISSLPPEGQALFESGRSAEMSVAVGLAMMAADERLFRLEIVPEELVARRRFWRGTAWAIAAGAVLVGVLGVDYSGVLRARDRAMRRHLQLVETLRGTADADALALRDALGSGAPAKESAGFEAAVKKYRNEVQATDLVARRARLLVSPGQCNVPVLGFIRLLRAVTPRGIVLTGLEARHHAPGSGLPSRQVHVTVRGLANPGVLAEGDEYKGLENYRRMLQEESGKLAFAIEQAKITTGDKVGNSGRSFTLAARIFTLGVESEEEEDGGEGDAGGERPEPPGPARPAPGPVIVPRAAPSRLEPLPPVQPAPGGEEEEDRGEDKGKGEEGDGGSF
jgi:Tfp pilus assembly PilM family ATPase